MHCRLNQTFPLGNGYQGTQSNGQPQNDIVKRPRLRKRKVNWKISGFSECSKPCGGGL